MDEFEREVEIVEDLPPYTLVFNELITDDSLRLQTRAALILMLSRPKDWDFSVRGMAKIANVSKDTMTKMVAELEEAGYIKRKSQSRKSGRFGKAGFLVASRPIYKREVASSPCPNFSDTILSYTKNSPQQNKEQQIKEQEYPYPCKQEIFEEAVTVIRDVWTQDDAKATQEAVMEKLSEHGFECRCRVHTDSRDGDTPYTGRLGIEAVKADTVIAVQIDRKSPREKSLHKLREYPCDFRIIALREGTEQPVPTGINALILLKSKSGELFERFWKAYPRKKAKSDAKKAWDKLKPSMELCRTMSAALDKAKRSEEWTKDGGRYIPYPATWLNGRRWEDETVPIPDNPPASRAVVDRGEVPDW